MTERKLLGILESVLETIKNNKFNSPQHEVKVKQIHEKVTLRLFEMGKMQKVAKLRFNVNKERPEPNFVPMIIDRIPAEPSIAGLIVEQGNCRPVERLLLGRVCEIVRGNTVAVVEYFRPQGEDPLLFRVAKKCSGITGTEGLVRKIIPVQQARALLFTGCESNIIVQRMPIEKKELAGIT